MGHVRILKGSDRYVGELELASGDSVLVSSTPVGDVLLSLDDVDKTPVPTGRITPSEADRIALMLNTAAGHARRAL